MARPDRLVVALCFLSGLMIACAEPAHPLEDSHSVASLVDSVAEIAANASADDAAADDAAADDAAAHDERAETISAAPPAAPAGPPRVEPLAIEGDLPGAIIRGLGASPPHIVFLGGVCSKSAAYLHTFPQAAQAAGGAIAIEGERECAHNPAFRTFARHAPTQDRRIESALLAAGWDEVPDGLTIIGYSLGATVVEDLAVHNPKRYSRVVLIGSPKTPRIEALRNAIGVASVSCSLDVPWRMQAAVDQLAKVGTRAQYFEMPGCPHGWIADGDRVFTDVFDFLGTRLGSG